VKPKFFGAPIQLRVVYALVASLLWWAIVESGEPLGLPFYGTGAVFAALVLVPFLPNLEGANKLRALALLLCGMLSYWAAVNLLLLFGDYSRFMLEIAGVVGAVIVGVGARLLIPLVLRRSGWLMLVAAGCLGAIVLDVGIDLGFTMKNAVPNKYLLPGHVAWQVLVCAALYYGSTLKGSMAGPATAPE
jgi:hypothetical protein